MVLTCCKILTACACIRVLLSVSRSGSGIRMVCKLQTSEGRNMKGKVSQHMCAVRRGLGWLSQFSISSYTDPATGRVETSALGPKPQAHHVG